VLTTSPVDVRKTVAAHADRFDWRTALTLVGILASVVVFALEVYGRRWISDDGLIAMREVRQVLDGNGPTYNAFERDEVNTSALWTWVLVFVSVFFRGDPALVAVWTGGVLAVGGIAVALDACRRFQRSRGADGVLLPAGVLVVLGVIPFWDYGTSGLETGLCYLWLAGAWWMLVTVSAESSAVRRHTTAVVVGLGPLVRPDFGLATILFFVALVVLLRARLKSAGLLLASAAALPLGYEVFRAGYYGILVPMPGLAKEASGTHWDRGFGYFNDFVGSYKLWLPLALFCVLATHLYGRVRPPTREIVLIATPIATGALLCAYVLRVGGDYMHARMWLPPVLVMLLPLFLVPATRVVGAIVAMVGLWAVVAGVDARTTYRHDKWGPQLITNEREFEAEFFKDKYPVSSDSHLGGAWGTYLEEAVTQARQSPVPVLLYLAHDSRTDTAQMATIPLAADRKEKFAFFWDNMGMTAVLTSLDENVVDRNGLATPLSGHLRLDRPGRAGHEKSLPLAWVLAKYADPAAVDRIQYDPNVKPAEVAAARRALACGDLKELIDSTEAPMSFSRFWDNLVGAWDRTRLRIPSDPFEAEREFCR
jgi:arabinofuranosyltransferase